MRQAPLILAILLLAGLASRPLRGQTIVLGGSPWVVSLDATDVLSQEAGNDLASELLSDPAQSTFSINYGFFYELFVNYAWSVQVRATVGGLPTGVGLAVLRTDNGTPFLVNGGISGGNINFIPLTTSNQAFFQGNRGRLNVGIQYRLSGLSIPNLTPSFSTTVTYTITSP